MDESPRPKWRIGIRGALWATLGVSVGMALVRVGLVVGPPAFFDFGILVINLTVGTLAAVFLGRSPAEGLVWGMLAFLIGLAGWVLIRTVTDVRV